MSNKGVLYNRATADRIEHVIDVVQWSTSSLRTLLCSLNPKCNVSISCISTLNLLVSKVHSASLDDFDGVTIRIVRKCKTLH